MSPISNELNNVVNSDKISEERYQLLNIYNHLLHDTRYFSIIMPFTTEHDFLENKIETWMQQLELRLRVIARLVRFARVGNLCVWTLPHDHPLSRCQGSSQRWVCLSRSFQGRLIVTATIIYCCINYQLYVLRYKCVNWIFFSSNPVHVPSSFTNDQTFV